MKKNIYIILFTFTILSACSPDRIPEPINEEEVITTLTIELTPDNGGDIVTLTSRDIDGDGPDAPEINISGSLVANTAYSGTETLLNETVFPAEIITEEVEEEGVDHQFFYELGGNVNAAIAYKDSDLNGDPIGIEFTLTTVSAGSGSLTATLRHKPDKSEAGVRDGDITNAGGETDFAQIFNITVE